MTDKEIREAQLLWMLFWRWVKAYGFYETAHVFTYQAHMSTHYRRVSIDNCLNHLEQAVYGD